MTGTGLTTETDDAGRDLHRLNSEPRDRTIDEGQDYPVWPGRQDRHTDSLLLHRRNLHGRGPGDSVGDPLPDLDRGTAQYRRASFFSLGQAFTG